MPRMWMPGCSLVVVFGAASVCLGGEIPAGGGSGRAFGGVSADPGPTRFFNNEPIAVDPQVKPRIVTEFKSEEMVAGASEGVVHPSATESFDLMTANGDPISHANTSEAMGGWAHPAASPNLLPEDPRSSFEPSSTELAAITGQNESYEGAWIAGVICITLAMSGGLVLLHRKSVAAARQVEWFSYSSRK